MSVHSCQNLSELINYFRETLNIEKSILDNFISKTCLKPQLFIVKRGVYRGINYFFSFLLKNIDCG